MKDGYYYYEGERYPLSIRPVQVIIQEAAMDDKAEAEAWKELDEMSINELYGVS